MTDGVQSNETHSLFPGVEAKHPTYRMAVGRPAKAFYRGILGIRVRVNLLGMLHREPASR